MVHCVPYTDADIGFSLRTIYNGAFHTYTSIKQDLIYLISNNASLRLPLHYNVITPPVRVRVCTEAQQIQAYKHSFPSHHATFLLSRAPVLLQWSFSVAASLASDWLLLNRCISHQSPMTLYILKGTRTAAPLDAPLSLCLTFTRNPMHYTCAWESYRPCRANCGGGADPWYPLAAAPA